MSQCAYLGPLNLKIRYSPCDLIAYLEKKYNSLGNYHPQDISMQVRIQDFLIGGSNLQRGSIC